jgi:hypothetical protein
MVVLVTKRFAMNNEQEDRTHSGQQESNRGTKSNNQVTEPEESRNEIKKEHSIGKSMGAADRPRKSFHNDGPGGNYKGY